jgi:hypothetical protein
MFSKARRYSVPFVTFDPSKDIAREKGIEVNPFAPAAKTCFGCLIFVLQTHWIYLKNKSFCAWFFYYVVLLEL